MSNGGNADYGREQDLAMYDRLPPEVRKMLRECSRSVTAYQVEGIRRKYGLDDAELVDEIKQRVESLRKEWMRETWQEQATSHPDFPT